MTDFTSPISTSVRWSPTIAQPEQCRWNFTNGLKGNYQNFYETFSVFTVAPFPSSSTGINFYDLYDNKKIDLETACPEAAALPNSKLEALPHRYTGDTEEQT